MPTNTRLPQANAPTDSVPADGKRAPPLDDPNGPPLTAGEGPLPNHQGLPKTRLRRWATSPTAATLSGALSPSTTRWARTMTSPEMHPQYLPPATLDDPKADTDWERAMVQY